MRLARFRMFEIAVPHLPIEGLLLTTAMLLVVAVFASKASGRLGIPALLLFVAVGMLAGSEGPGRIHFDDVQLTQTVGVIALCFILFSGGFDTVWRQVRGVATIAALLATMGTLLTALAVGAFAHLALGFSPAEGFLLGAIISSTDAAAVFAVLRGGGVAVPDRARAILELESGSNDPMAVFLTGAAIHFVTSGTVSVSATMLGFTYQMVVGAGIGFVLGRLLVALLNRLNLYAKGLYAVLTMASVIGVYAAASIAHANGFLAVYVAALVLGSRRFVQKRTLNRFHDAIAWLMQITMFLALGLLSYPSQLIPVAPTGIATALFLMFVARPLAVGLTLAPMRVPLREIGFIAWAGLRGAIPIILATFPLLAGVDRGGELFHLVFFVVLLSVLVQGPTLPFAARLLLAAPSRRGADDRVLARKDSDLITVVPSNGSPMIGQRIVTVDFPDDVLVLAIYRDGNFFVPDGSTTIEPADRLLVLTSKSSVEAVRAMFA